MSRGRPFEQAISRAASRYRKEHRALLVRQLPPTSTGADGLLIYTGRAPVDFLGVLAGGQALAIEVKSTRKTSWPVDELREDQRAAMGALHDLGADVRLIVAYETIAETYSLAWPVVAGFIAAPWRASLSVAWCRAYGMLAPELERVDTSRRRCLFLDAAAHPGAAQARADVEAEQARAAARPPRVEPEQEPLDIPPRVYVAPSEEERRARIIRAANEGLARQLKKAGQAQRFGRGRR